MPLSLSVTHLHLIFSTKHGHPWLSDPILRGETQAQLGGISKQRDCPPVIVGGVADHVHVLVRFGRGITQSEWVKEMKRVSRLWIKTQHAKLSHFAGQSGHGIYSVSVSSLDQVEAYIRHQEEHHRKISFQDEYRAFLHKHREPCDERYGRD